MTPAGSPAIVARAAKDAIAPPGIPGVPTDRSTFAKSTSTIMEMLTFTLHALAKNMIINDIKISVAYCRKAIISPICIVPAST